MPIQDFAPINPTQLYRELNDIKEGQTSGFSGVHDRLDTLNGRTRRLEIKVAVISFIVGALGSISLALLPEAFAAALRWIK